MAVLTTETLAQIEEVLGEKSEQVALAIRDEIEATEDHGVKLFMGTLIGAALALLRAERDQDGGIDTFGDALWRAFNDVTATGEAGCVPKTAAGRIVSSMLVLFGAPLYEKTRVKCAELVARVTGAVRAAEAAPTGYGDEAAAGKALLEKLDARTQSDHERVERIEKLEESELQLLVRMAKLAPKQQEHFAKILGQARAQQEQVTKMVAKAEEQKTMLHQLTDLSRKHATALQYLSHQADANDQVMNRIDSMLTIMKSLVISAHGTSGSAPASKPPAEGVLYIDGTGQADDAGGDRQPGRKGKKKKRKKR